jgi:5-methylcytosine-specific restriction endonuclease McrA
MMNEGTIRRKYSNCCAQSFKTRLELFLFKKALDGGGDIYGFSEKEFMDYRLKDKDIEKYAGVYWQQRYDYQIDGKVKVDNIYSAIQKHKLNHAKKIIDLKKSYAENFHKILPYEAIKELLQGKKCEYCNLTPDDIDKLTDNNKIYKKKDTRGFTLEIDRKEANKEYASDNIVLCCYWCNNAKTDEFSYKEFKEVIGPAIQNVWEARLKNSI